jgi:hypothetical protein
MSLQKLFGLYRRQALLPHKPSYSMTSDSNSFRFQLGFNAARAVAPCVPGKDFQNQFARQNFFAVAGSWFEATIIRTSVNTDHLAQILYPIADRFAFNEATNFFQVIREKMDKAFFKMSRSISTCRSLARNSETS